MLTLTKIDKLVWRGLDPCQTQPHPTDSCTGPAATWSTASGPCIHLFKSHLDVLSGSLTCSVATQNQNVTPSTSPTADLTALLPRDFFVTVYPSISLQVSMRMVILFCCKIFELPQNVSKNSNMKPHGTVLVVPPCSARAMLACSSSCRLAV